jgi:hypothetical protein
VYLELIMVIFRISENTSVIADAAKRANGGPKTPEA